MTDSAQSRQALALGNQRRRHQAWLRREIARQKSPTIARDMAASIIRDPFPDEAGMKLEKLLGAIPGVGQREITRLLTVADITVHDARLREITPLRRQALCRALTGEKREVAA